MPLHDKIWPLPVERAASIARLSAVIVSAAYCVLIVPQLGFITLRHFASGWVWGAITIAIAWVPLLIFKERLEGRLVLSFLPIALFLAYFGALFSVA